MTVTGSHNQVQSRRRERRSIPPYGDGTSPNAISNILDRLLERSRFAPLQDSDLGEEDTHFLTAEECQRGLHPRFEIAVDSLEELAKNLGIEEDDLEVGLSVRSPKLRRYEVLQTWTIQDLPVEPWSPEPARLQELETGRGMDFILAMRVVSGREDLRSKGLDKGKVLCRKVFSVKESVDTFTFPFRWAEFGGDNGVPDEALWTIQWYDSDDSDQFNRPVHEVLTVLVNKRAEGPLTAMGEANGSGDLGWKMLAADITTQIFWDVLSKIDDEPEEGEIDSLVGQVFTRLSSAGNIPYSEVRGLVDKDDSLSELRGLVAKVLKVVA